MQDMREIQSNTIDSVVSVSAIEHMEKESISKAICEFNRVLKENQPMFITTSASNSDDWYHKPSEGWCFSSQTLSRLFNIRNERSKSFNKFGKLLSEYRNNTFLKSKLASIYFVSEKNGMPNGIWDPRYVPVGIISTKKNV
jgi:ubiquinone/menaquinone biosynthesis C-methylase UbiE